HDVAPLNHPLFCYLIRRHPRSPLFPYTTLFRSRRNLPSSSKSSVPGFSASKISGCGSGARLRSPGVSSRSRRKRAPAASSTLPRSEEHTSELQSRGQLVCRLLLEKKNRQSLVAR